MRLNFSNLIAFIKLIKQQFYINKINILNNFEIDVNINGQLIAIKQY